MLKKKDQITSAIVRARAELDQVLCELDRIPIYDATSVGYTAHALNNYLSVIQGTTDLLLLPEKIKSDDVTRKLIEGVLQATERMAPLVSSLMNHASNHGPAKLVLEEINLVLLTQRCCHYYRQKAQLKQIELHGPTTAEPILVWGDRVALAAVLDNLLSNAVKYSPLGKTVKVSLASTPGGAVCTVADEGPGLAPEAQKKLYQKGVRLGSVPTAGEPSTGFGLAVAKDLLESMGGRIWCESTLGLGARFSFLVPAGERKQCVEEAACPASAVGAK